MPQPAAGGCRSGLLAVFACVALPLVWLHGRYSSPLREAARDDRGYDHSGDGSKPVLEAQVRTLRRQVDSLRRSQTTASNEPTVVTLYSQPYCRGESVSFGAASAEEKCKSCKDTCGGKFDSGAPMHGDATSNVKSARVRGPGVLRTHASCLGTFHYPQRPPLENGYTQSDGCVHLRDESAHFLLDAAPAAAVGGLHGSPEGPASRFQSRDWMEPQVKKLVHQNWTDRFETPETASQERVADCGNTEANAANAEGVRLVRAHVELANINPVDDLSVAEPFFERAIELAPECSTPRLNLAVVLLARLEKGELKQGRKLLESPQGGCIKEPKTLLYCGIYSELQAEEDLVTSGQSSEDPDVHYLAAFEADDTLPIRYLGRPHKSWGTRSVPPSPRLFYDPNDATQGNFEAHETQRRGLRKLLVFKEFASHFGGYGGVTKEQADSFLDVWYIHLPRLVPPYPISVLRDTYRKMVRGRMLRWQGAETRSWPENRWTHHNGPMARFLQAAILPRIASLTDTNLVPTYTYFGAYWAGGGILPHLDREQCEYTLTITIDAHPLSAVCPFGVAAEPNRIKKRGYTDVPFRKNKLPPEDRRVLVQSYVGDGALIRGRGVVHWRPPSPANCSQFFFHYVRKEFTGDLN